ncbi:hypothetical protein [Halobacillus litoralis]|uniref:hypothetical protein n=1 Tax=Halobacillus litoralis TaxID=45668 RepID=UPI001CFE4EC0|nr:hypothetical protein [Halobacillus litoralis]
MTNLIVWLLTILLSFAAIYFLPLRINRKEKLTLWVIGSFVSSSAILITLVYTFWIGVLTSLILGIVCSVLIYHRMPSIGGDSQEAYASIGDEKQEVFSNAEDHTEEESLFDQGKARPVLDETEGWEDTTGVVESPVRENDESIQAGNKDDEWLEESLLAEEAVEQRSVEQSADEWIDEALIPDAEFSNRRFHRNTSEEDDDLPYVDELSEVDLMSERSRQLKLRDESLFDLREEAEEEKIDDFTTFDDIISGEIDLENTDVVRTYPTKEVLEEENSPLKEEIQPVLWEGNGKIT